MRMTMAVLAVCSGVFLTALPALADDTVDATRSIIDQQISAFLSDDADTAYSFASPAIKGLFPDKDRFFAMVKKSYQPVYHPGNYAFGRSKVVGDLVLQEVLISGTEGKDYTAIYQMQRQPDGSYKINGVQMLQNTESTGI